MKYPESTFEFNGETIQVVWMKTDSLDNIFPISQVYGICFNDKNEILLGKKVDSWNLPGGTPEGNESIEETLTREVLEEVDTKIKNIKVLGAQKVFPIKTPEKYAFQVRCICEVDELLPQTPDPDNGLIWERKFVPIEKANEYLKWGETGETLFKDALQLHKKQKSIEELRALLSGKYKDINELPYRQGVIGIVMNDKNEFLVVQMVSYAENQWRFPGGGLDEGETHSQALLRELKEELNSDKFEIIKESTQVNKYDWPEFVIADQIKNKNRYFRGQEQRQFLVKFTGTPEDIKADPGELREIKWVPYEELESHFVFDRQWELAEKVLTELL